MRQPSPENRDAALRGVSRITRWTIAGSVALTAGFGGLAAKSFSGKKHATTTTTNSVTREGNEGTSGNSGQSSGSQSSSSDDSNSQLQAPSNAPSFSSGSGQVSSGGS